jgi:CheY-like chemotaxis protein
MSQPTLSANQSAQPRILLIDDEANGETPQDFDPYSTTYMWYYTQELRESGFVVVETNNVDDAIAILEFDPQGFDAIVLDLMMPWGQMFTADETEQGVRTGVLLADRISEISPRSRIVVLTNQGNESTLSLLKDRSRNVLVCAKIDFPPDRFVDQLRSILATGT